MLVLTRKLHEQIKIGHDITITIVRLHGNTVRVGIDAPKNVRVTRSELLARIAAEAAAKEQDQLASTQVAKSPRAAGAEGDHWPTVAESLTSEGDGDPPAVGRETFRWRPWNGPWQAPLAGMVRANTR
jgi:carbon storage regulator CsrA